MSDTPQRLRRPIPITFVRGGRVMQTRIMVGPTTVPSRENSSKAKFVGTNDTLPLRRYREKSELLADEQQELERLENADEMQKRRLFKHI